MNWVRVSGPLCINLDRVNMVRFEPMTEICTVTWATGDAPLELQGEEALAFMGALDQYPFVEAEGVWLGNPYRTDEDETDVALRTRYKAVVVQYLPDESV
jgi:hypothetical protein